MLLNEGVAGLPARSPQHRMPGPESIFCQREADADHAFFKVVN
jgi:hypothetical protein